MIGLFVDLLIVNACFIFFNKDCSVFSSVGSDLSVVHLLEYYLELRRCELLVTSHRL